MKLILVTAIVFSFAIGAANAMCIHIRDNSQLYCYVKAPIDPGVL
jgi:hypothetical protein